MSAFALQVTASLSLGAGLALWLAIALFYAESGRESAQLNPRSSSRWAILRSLLAFTSAPIWFRNLGRVPGPTLIHAGVPLNEDEFGALRWLSSLCGGVGALVIGIARNWDLLGDFLSGSTLCAAYLTPLLWVRWRKEQRATQLDLLLPNLMDRLRFGLEAGLGFETALRRASATFPGVLGEEMRRVLRQLDLGYPRSLAMLELADRNPSLTLRRFVSSINQADRLGSSLTKILQVESARLRADRHRRAEEASRRLPILIVFPLVFFFLPALLVVYLAPPLLHLLVR